MKAGKTALAIIAAALAAGIAPDRSIAPSAWASENLIVADGPLAGEKYDLSLTPYAVEILDHLAADSPCNLVSVRKSAQTGLTGAGIAWVGSIIDVAPAKTMIIFPTILSVQEFNREKLTPAIEASPALRRKVRVHRSRSRRSSTALSKAFAGGSLTLTGANSAADLRSKTVKNLFCDEIDEWPADLDGQGDPMEMANARLIAHHAAGDYKKFEISTPTIKGASRIDVSFEAGDQRRWEVPCPHCEEFQVLEFGDAGVPTGLKFSREYPFDAHYICRHCGAVIEHYLKAAMIDAGRWRATMPGPGRHPSYHIDSLSSKLTTWDEIVKAFLAAKDDPQKLKTFVNLWLGQAWEERGDAPEWTRLYVRREDYTRRQIPAGALIVTVAVDVQADGLFFETVAWGPGEVSWSVDVGFLPGDTGSADNPVWRALDEIYARRYPNAWGNYWEADACGVDSGFNTTAVYAWVRRHPKALALKGLDGWHRPALGTPAKQDVTWKGKKKPRGLVVWPVGTWGLKAKLYANLRKDGPREGAESVPGGYCHFAEFHDEAYFKQLTAEYLRASERKGRLVREWVARGPNHYHDCRVYNMALAAHLGVPDWTSAQWASLSQQRGAAVDAPDLVELMSALPPAAAAASAAPRKGRRMRSRGVV